MSCGNRFQCGMRKPTRFSFQPDKPSNPELHNENQKRLSDLLKAREEMDKAFTQPPKNQAQAQAQAQTQTQISLITLPETPLQIETNYTPWTTPSTDWKSK